MFLKRLSFLRSPFRSGGSERSSRRRMTAVVVAGALLRERVAVVARLRRMGAHIVDAPAAQIGPAVVNAYLDLKRRDLL